MNSSLFPGNYSAWKVCITEKCNIPLTMEYVKKRLDLLRDETSKVNEGTNISKSNL